MPIRDGIMAEEFRQRVALVAAEARARSLDAVLVWSRGGATLERHQEVLWLTNFYNPWCAVTDSPYWTGQAYAAALVTAAGTCVLITNVPYVEWRHQPVVCDAHTNEPFMHESAAGALRARGLERGRIGLSGRSALAVDLHERVVDALPEVEWIVADDIVPVLMEVKTGAELEIVREAGRVGDAQMAAMLDVVAPGVTEQDVAGAGIAACVAAGGMPYVTHMASGPAEHRLSPESLPTWSGRLLAEGDLWRVDLIGAYQGYMFDFARSTVVGSPSDAQEALLESAIAVVESVIAVIEPGRPIAEAARTGTRALARHAPSALAATTHDYPHFGHTIGPGWGGIWLCDLEPRAFAEGMVFAVEVVVAHPELGAPMFEQNVIVRPGGTELITHSPTRPWTA